MYAAGISERLKLYAPIPGKTVEVQITNPVFIDPKNERLKN